MASISTDISTAIRLLKGGQLVAIPTETVYGLAGNALDAAVVAKIFEAKGRPSFDPLICHVPDVAAALNYVSHIPETARQLTARFWPGPLTLVLPRKKNIPDLVTSGLDTVGIRCPSHPLTQQLLRHLPFPLAAPSANPFGYVSPTTAQHVQDQLGEKINYILDGGPCPVGIESTILSFEGDDATVLRLGGLSAEEIESCIGPVKLHLHSSSNPVAPGQLKSHYAPRKKMITGNIEQLLRQHPRAGVLSFQTNYNSPHQFILSPSGDMAEAAKNLFTALRMLDNHPTDIILAEYVPEAGLGRAINDRLRRASA
jgi:L-threonylcarbamoyladenylate synthase